MLAVILEDSMPDWCTDLDIADTMGVGDKDNMGTVGKGSS